MLDLFPLPIIDEISDRVDTILKPSRGQYTRNQEL